MKKSLRLFFSFVFILFSVSGFYAQNQQSDFTRKLKDHHSVPKEVAYLHLNKTVLLQGEQLGFSAYVTNKADLKPSTETTNLYVQVKNRDGEVVKQKMLLVENGVASNVFAIDSTFTSGEYSITAFTNWMRNFEEQNYFTENFEVISSNLDHKQQEEATGKIDAQFLPESGNLLSHVINTVGVVVKDNMGYGLSNATVVIKDAKNKVVNQIRLNQFGIGKFTLIPDLKDRYTAVVSYDGKEIPVAFNTPIVPEGIVLSAVQRDKELRLLVNTNAESFLKLRDKTFFLLVQSRALVEAHELRFGDRESIAVVLDLEYLQSGMNILTLVDENRQPIAERLFFNYEGLRVEGMKEPQISSINDSLNVQFSGQEMDSTRISVSILPQKTVSHGRNHNIVSYNLLQPYVRGPIENGGWYFLKITKEKKFELDKLLITQGWSSYNWESIFNFEEKIHYPFEEKIVVKGLINSPNSRRDELRYMIHATDNSNPMVLEIPSSKDAFVVDGFQPVEGEQLLISRIKNNDKLLPAGLSVQFFPSTIPHFKPSYHSLPQKFLLNPAANHHFIPVRPFRSSAEELKEVLVETHINKKLERERKLGEHAFGRVHVVTEKDVPIYGTLESYLKSKNVWINFNPLAQDTVGPHEGMVIYLDGIPFSDKSFFYNYPLSSIDYVEINRTGMGNGFIGSNGSIKIYSDFTSSKIPNRERDRIQQFDIPLAYSREKKYYVPKYENENDTFFESYGVIDWIPTLFSEGDTGLSFTIKKPEVDFQMIIEGFTADGKLIYDVKTVSAGE